jgi:hypothetical protein
VSGENFGNGRILRFDWCLAHPPHHIRQLSLIAEARQGMGSKRKPNGLRRSKVSVIGLCVLSGSCPDCQATLRRVAIEDVVTGRDSAWTRRFADAASGLEPGRYLCDECLSEWWRFPAAAAS